MNRVQKVAWLTVISISAAVLSSSLAVGILYIKFGFPTAATGLSLLGIAGFGGLGPLIFKKDKGAVTCDERDKIINHRAVLASFEASYLAVGLACMLPFIVYGPRKTISITCLPMIFGGAALVAFFTHSLAILIQYGCGDKGEQS